MPGVSGTWKDLTDSVNFMAVEPHLASARHRASRHRRRQRRPQTQADAAGQAARSRELAETINGMIDTLGTFADQVTTVAREVGFEGKLGGQAEVPGAAGSVARPHRQRQPARRAAHVADPRDRRGRDRRDQGRPLANDRGRRARRSRRADRERQRDDSQPARHDAQEHRAGLAQDQPRALHRDAAGPARHQDRRRLIMSEIAPLVNAQAGALYVNEPSAGEPLLRLIAELRDRRIAKAVPDPCMPAKAWSGNALWRSGASCLPKCRSDYIDVGSGLGSMRPLSLIVLPVLFEGDVKAVMELASLGTSAKRTCSSWTSSPSRSASSLIRSPHRCEPKSCSNSRKRSPANCKASRWSCSTPTTNSRRKARLLARAQRGSRDAARAKSTKRGKSSNARPNSSRSPRSTSRSSWRTCRTSCARRSTAC